MSFQESKTVLPDGTITALSPIPAWAIMSSNYQYQSLVSRLENGGSWYRTQQTMYGGTPTINNDFCVKLCIANIMCNLCCGGGGFFCGSPYTYH